MTLAAILAQKAAVFRVPHVVRARSAFLVVGACIVGLAAAATYAFTGDTLIFGVGTVSVLGAIALLLWPSRCVMFDLERRSLRHGNQVRALGDDVRLRLEARERGGAGGTSVMRVVHYALVCEVNGESLDLTECDDRATLVAIGRYLAERLGVSASAIDGSEAPARVGGFTRWLPIVIIVLFALASSYAHNCAA